MSKDKNINILNSLKRSLLYEGLTMEELNLVYEQTRPVVRAYDQDEIIVDQGSRVSSIGVIKSGTVASIKYDLNGEAQLLRTYKQGGVICLDTLYSKSQVSPVALICQTDCIIGFTPFLRLFESTFIGVATREKILHNIARILSDEHVQLIFKIDLLSMYTLEERIMTYLRHMKDKSGQDTFDIGLTQKQFADFLWVNRSVLSTELNRMRKEGMIDYEKSRFKILAPE